MSGNARSALLLLLFLSPLSFLLSSCSGGGGFVSEDRSNRGYNPGVGPFDSRGNYVERWADDKSKGRQWRRATTSGATAVAAAQPTAKPSLPHTSDFRAAPTPTRSTTTKPPSRPSTPPVASASRPKPTVKAKPTRKAPIRHTIKKGDTLWALSRKYKTSVTAIQRANGLKGTNLRIGRTLLIPRY